MSVNYKLNLINNYYLNNMFNSDFEDINKLLKFPIKDYYYNHKKIHYNKIKNILINRDIDKHYKPKYGVITNRCNGKLLPSNIILYNKITDNYFDSNQATELNICLPIYIIHISKDKLWYFIKTYNYYCWVEKKYVCIINKQIFKKYLTPKDFVITTKRFYIDNTFFDIGIKLPLVNITMEKVKILIPKTINNKYKEEIIEINKNNINIGYLKYNYNNLYKIALRYLHTPYGWGGINNGVDCSGMISNIYKVFGYLLPRDTSIQQKCIGNIIINLNNSSFIQKYKIMESIKRPAILYTKGHVMLMINNNKKNIYVIHSSSKKMFVTISKLDNKTINNITSIHFI